jgi:hypothetical protein
MNSRRRTLVLSAMVVVLWAMPAGAQEPEGAKDRPMIPRMPNFQIGEYDYSDFASATFPLPDDGEKTVEGKHWRITFFLKEGARKSSELEILRNYVNAFKAKNWKSEFLQDTR